MCEITGTKQYSRDLPQGGMEIPCVYVFRGDHHRLKFGEVFLRRLFCKFANSPNLSPINPAIRYVYLRRVV